MTLLNWREAEKFTAEPPRPLVREVSPAEPFPVDCLGSILGSAATGIQETTQAPLAICAQSVIAAATLAVQGHADVILPTTRKPRPVSGYFMSIAATGERKSAADEHALGPVRAREVELGSKRDAELLAFTNAKQVWDQERKKIVSGQKSDVAAKRKALNDLGPEPNPPLVPLLTCPEPTFEGLCRLMAEGYPSLGVFSAEGGQFIGGYGMSADQKLKTAAAMSGLWDGSPVKRVRAGEFVILPGRRVTQHLMAQPNVAARMLSDPDLADQGLLSRVLPVAPASTAGTRFFQPAKPEGEMAIRRYEDTISQILREPPPLAEGKRNELVPRQITASPAAAKMLLQFSDHVERLTAPGGDMEPIRGMANKLAEHACRLAAVLALVDDTHTGEISQAHMAAGIELSQHYASEALRVFAAGALDPNISRAQQLLEWLQSRWKESAISLVEIYQRGPNAIREKKTAKLLVAILEEHGWLARIEDGATVSGVKRREAWQIARGAVA